MAKITRGSRDKLTKMIKTILDEYEIKHPGAIAEVYRQNSGSIRIRIVSELFSRLSKGKRHDSVWKFITDRLSGDDFQEISVLLLLTPEEQNSSFMNSEFDDPVPSRF